MSQEHKEELSPREVDLVIDAYASGYWNMNDRRMRNGTQEDCDDATIKHIEEIER